MRTSIAKQYIILCLTIFSIGCNSEEKHKKVNQEPKAETVVITDTLSLELDGQKKWISNLETHEGMINMKTIISDFNSNKETDYKFLGENLSKQTSYIIKHCSMKGTAHDQLHVVLIPMLDEISILKEEDNKKKLTFALQNLELLIKAYFNHFEV